MGIHKTSRSLSEKRTYLNWHNQWGIAWMENRYGDSFLPELHALHVKQNPRSLEQQEVSANLRNRRLKKQTSFD